MGDFEEITGWEVLVIINSFALEGPLLLQSLSGLAQNELRAGGGYCCFNPFQGLHRTSFALAGAIAASIPFRACTGRASRWRGS